MYLCNHKDLAWPTCIRDASSQLNITKMKVLKFGGTSVGSVESIRSVKQIVEKAARKSRIVVVVSALGGVTDQLLRTADLAMMGNEAWRTEYDDMVSRHHTMIDTLISDPTDRERLFSEVDTLLSELQSIFYGVYLIRDLSRKTRDGIVSYGERLSSRIAATLIRGSRRIDARTFIHTRDVAGKHTLDTEATRGDLAKTFTKSTRITLVPGFIASDSTTGETTNLGRGGSDYTAAIIAAELQAEVLEIWTDVDGFMTADPRVIQSAYTIDELSYIEAMELCNFGAKVIYPPTIYPVCVKRIPIRVKNTFNPAAPGTIIKDHIAPDHKPIKGISSIKGTTLINVSGLSMVGVIGVNKRIFSSLAREGVSVFLVSQASSENSSSIGVRDEDAQRAIEVLNAEFADEITSGAMFPMHAEANLATIAVVGENMKHTPGIAGKLFGTLGRSGISVIACAQGGSETNISFVVESRWLRKALNVIHDSFFLSEYKELNLFVCGVGTVGGKLLEQIAAQADELKRRSRLKINVVGIASSRHAIYRREGIDLNTWRAELDASPLSDAKSLKEHIIGMNIFNAVFADCTASADIAAIYLPLLQHNISVVAANKIAASGPYDHYQQLKRTALARGVKYLFETNVGAGLPIIGTMNDLRNSGDTILHIEAVLSGTVNYIFDTLSAEVPFSRAVQMAKERGFSEPDPRIDLSGHDVVRKLVILAREAGYEVEQDQVELTPFVPEEMFRGSLDDFWRELPSLDDGFERRRRALEAEGKRLRFVAEMDHNRLRLSLKAVDRQHPFYNLEGSNNIVTLTTERYREYPMLIQGYGAGASVTAAGVFANVMSVMNI